VPKGTESLNLKALMKATNTVEVWPRQPEEDIMDRDGFPRVAKLKDGSSVEISLASVADGSALLDFLPFAFPTKTAWCSQTT